MINSSISEMRREYTRAVLDEREVDADPFRQFRVWFDQARIAAGHEPNAMTVATASKDGVPSARMLLLKGFDERGFLFYTNYTSAKGLDLEENPFASLLFYWPELERQVRIAGTVQKIAIAESSAYFQSRPPGSQIAAHLNLQSQAIPGREFLQSEYSRLEARFEGQEIPPPAGWGGYRLAPDMFEFWQGRVSRLHDRVRYRRDDATTWIIERLGP